MLPQICHAPLKKPTTDAEQVLWNRLQLERQQSAVLLENLLQQVSFKKILILDLYCKEPVWRHCFFAIDSVVLPGF